LNDKFHYELVTYTPILPTLTPFDARLQPTIRDFLTMRYINSLLLTYFTYYYWPS